MIGETAKQGYSDALLNESEPVCTESYYKGQLAAMYARLHECAAKIRDIRDETAFA